MIRFFDGDLVSVTKEETILFRAQDSGAEYQKIKIGDFGVVLGELAGEGSYRSHSVKVLTAYGLGYIVWDRLQVLK